MSWSRGASSSATVALAFAMASLVAPGSVRAEIWVVDGSVRVDPLTGEIIETRHPGGDGVDAGYRDENLIWRSEDRTIRLLAARNEVVEFQAVVDGGPHQGLEIEVSDLVGPGGEILVSAEQIRRFREWFVQVSRESSFCGASSMVTSLGPGWYPDALIPLDVDVSDGFGQPFDVPDERNNLPGQTATAFWVDVLVPEGTPAGLYEGEVRIRMNGDVEVLPLELDVRPITLSSVNHSGVGAINYGGLTFEVWHRDGEPSGLLPWYQIFHAHRLELDALWSWPPRAPGDTDGHFDEWREAMRPFFSGEAFTAARGYHGPAQGEPVYRFTMPNESNYPGPHFSWGDPRPVDEAAWQAALREVEGILIDEGWTDLEAHLFINGVDEPHDLEAFERVQYYGDLIDGAGLVDPRHVLFRLDAGQFKNIGAWIDGWDTGRIFDEIGGVVDVWNENGGPPYVDLEATTARLAEHSDEQFWIYSTCSAGEPAMGSVAIEGEALGMRTWGWIAFRYELDGAVSWEMDGMRHDLNVLNCWTDPQCTGWGINGDALLLYLGEYVGLDGQPVASIRFKNMRRGAQDYEYLRQMADVDPSIAAAFARDLIPLALDDGMDDGASMGRWSHAPDRYEAVRREIANLLPPEVPIDPDAGPRDAGTDADLVADADENVDSDGDLDGSGADSPTDGCGCGAAGEWRGNTLHRLLQL